MTRHWRAHRVGTHRAQLGESPRWDHHRQRLLYVDVYRGTVLSVDPHGEHDTVAELGEPVGCVALLGKPGKYLCAVESGLVGVEQGRRLRLTRWRQDGMRFNDGRCDPAGRFWVGSMAHGALDPEGRGVLYRWEPPGELRPMLRGVRISNGLAWDVARARMYYVDSARRRVDWYHWRDGMPLDGPRELIRFPPDAGSPDGIAVDAAGRVWVAMWEGGQVLGVDPDGDVFAVVRVPTPLVTACAFGGPELRTLYVTTACGDWPDFAARSGDPHAGALYAVELPVAGVPEHTLRLPDRLTLRRESGT